MKKNTFLSFSMFVLLSFYFVTFAFAQEGYKVGDYATDFNLLNVDGEMVTLESFEDAKGFIIIFTCNHCPFSVAYEDRIIELDKAFKNEGYPVIAINPNDAEAYPTDSYNEMIVRAEEKGFTFPYLHDETQEIAKAYGALKTPHVFLVQKKEAKYQVKYIGAIDDNTRNPEEVEEKYIEKAIADLKAGKKIEVPFTKAIGCSVKYKKQ